MDTYSSSVWMALEEFHIFLRGLVDSDPEVVASLSLCGHARRLRRQWHAFYWFCWSWYILRYVPDVCRHEVAALVVYNGSGMHSTGFAVWVHLVLCPDVCRH